VGFITYGTVINGDHSAFYDALERKTAGNIRGTVSSASHLGQSIIFKAMRSPTIQAERAEKVEILRKRAMRAKEVLANPKYKEVWEPYPFNSGYFMCLKLKTVNAEKLRLHLLDNQKVGLISINDTDMRITFSSVDEENIAELFELIFKGIKEIG